MRVLLATVCLWALTGAAAVGAEPVDRALAALSGGNRDAKLAAARVLAGASGPEREQAVSALLAAARGPGDATLRIAMIQALVDLRATDLVHDLLTGLTDERDERVAGALALAVGALGDAPQVPALKELAILHPSGPVRAAATTALGDIGGPEARLAVVLLLRRSHPGDAGWAERAAILLALAEVGEPSDLEAARTVYRDGGGERFWFARCAWARLVSALDPKPIGPLLHLARDPDRRVAVTAAAGFLRAGRLRAFLALLDDGLASVRAAAASAAAEMRHAPAYPRLRTLARFDRSRAVRWAAAVALFRAEQPEGDELVLEGVASTEPAVWAEAIRLLAERTGERHGRDPNAWRGALSRWRGRSR